MSTSFSYLKRKLVDFMDDQRLERLEQCRILEQHWKDCQTGGSNVQLEDFPGGIRMVRYFDWRNRVPLPSDQPCIREEHATWACRAVALQCGQDLVNLRACFQQVGPDVVLASETDYDDRQKDKEIPCAELQRALGACVSKSALELAQRQQERRDR